MGEAARWQVEYLNFCYTESYSISNVYTIVRVMAISEEDLLKAGKTTDAIRPPDKWGGGYMASLEFTHQIHCVVCFYLGISLQGRRDMIAHICLFRTFFARVFSEITTRTVPLNLQIHLISYTRTYVRNPSSSLYVIDC